MKYLKKIFEEVNRDEYEELKDFCEMYLAYLLDDSDWKIEITMKTQVYPDKGYYDIFLWRIYVVAPDGSASYPNVVWDDISDHFIPFFKVLTDNYELVPSVGRSMKDGSLVNNLVSFSGANVPKEKILNDLIPGNQPVRKIMFKVKRKL
jgi:hypothetical protein